MVNERIYRCPLETLLLLKQISWNHIVSPCCLLIKTERNNLVEIVQATVRKSHGEEIRRHVPDLIFLQQSSYAITVVDGKAVVIKCPSWGHILLMNV